MLGRFDEALPLAEDADAQFGERGGSWLADWGMAEIAALADDHEGACRRLTAVTAAIDHEGLLSTYAPMLGRELCALGRYDEAEKAAQLGRDVVREQDVGGQALWRQVFARVHASRDEHDVAERLAGEAVEMAERSDGLEAQGKAYCDLAEVLEAAGSRERAAAAWQEGLERYERKGIVPLAGRVRERLASLEPA
jgi:tetratricopeptide (TPR) repeat protein